MIENQSTHARCVSPMATLRTLAQLEAIIERGLQTYIEVGEALLEIRDGRLYRQSGYGAFEAYCRERWGWSRRYANYQIQAAKVAVNLGTIVPKNEAQARELAALTSEEQCRLAVNLDFRSATAVDVREAVEEARPGANGRLRIHFSSECEEWRTPPEIIERTKKVLGAIHLDPCSNAGEHPNVPAERHFVEACSSSTGKKAGQAELQRRQPTTGPLNLTSTVG